MPGPARGTEGDRAGGALSKPRLRTLGSSVPTLTSTLPVLTPGSWRSDKRGSTQRGYTYRWQQYRKGWLRRHPLCGDRLAGPSPQHSLCVQQQRVTAATDVDHIEAHRGDMGKFWDPENHQSLCGTCHDQYKAAIERAVQP